MENRAHALAAGLFTLVLGAALAAVAMWFGKEDLKLVPYIMTTTSSVTGLKVEAPVRYRGVDVGKVDEIAIDSANSGRVRIRIGVKEGTPITTSTYGQLGYQGITGLAYVLLGDDGKSKEKLESAGGEIAVIRMKPSLFDDGESLFGSIIEITDKVNELLDEENRGRVKRTLANLEDVLSALGQPRTGVMPAARGNRARSAGWSIPWVIIRRASYLEHRRADPARASPVFLEDDNDVARNFSAFTCIARRLLHYAANARGHGQLRLRPAGH
ncbi:MAG: MlaD family protein [Proteobacteria bacterium]|nr:MlaD family protein [Pseudomonadota bacterium]